MRNTLNLLILAFVLHTQIQMCYSTILTTTLSDSDGPTIKLPDCKGVGDVEEIGNVTDEDINEASGLAISSINDKLFWIIEDSGQNETVFGVRENGTTAARVFLENATNIDWEAITTAPCEKNSSEMCIFVADIGDNCRDRTNVSIYKFPEPDINNVENLRDEPQNISIEKGNWTIFHLTYPNEERHNCESIVIDPRTRDLIFFTKEDKPKNFCSKNTTFGFNCKVYSAPVDTPEDTTVELKDEEIVVHFPLDMSRQDNREEVATDASISEDGNTLIVRTNSSVSIYRNESSLTALEMMRTNQPCIKDLDHQYQGEGLSILPDGKAFYILSEGEQQPICRYSLKCGPNLC